MKEIKIAIECRSNNKIHFTRYCDVCDIDKELNSIDRKYVKVVRTYFVNSYGQEIK